MGAKTLASIFGLIALCAGGTSPTTWAASPGASVAGCTLRIDPGADVQGSLDRLAAAGTPATLCLAAGEFPLPGPLSIDGDGLGLRGEGPSTVLRLREGAQSPVIVVGDQQHQKPARPVSDVTIERLRVIGGGPGGSEFDADHPFLTNSAVVIRAGHNVTLRELDVRACRSACILTEHDCRDVTIERSTVSGSTWDGIAFNRTARARMVGNTIRDNRAAGITVEHLEDSVIDGNTISDNRSQGVYLSDSYRNRFRGNRFTGNTNAGVFLTCSVRQRDPEPARCWDDSMSQANAFEGNEFAGNRLGYIVAADSAANCRKPGVVPNVSRGDTFTQNPSIEQDAPKYGQCLREEPGEPGAGHAS